MNVNVPPGSIPNAEQPMEWPAGALTRIPFWIYQSPEIYAIEQQRLFEGPVWNYLCLEAEVAKPGDYRVTFIGSMPVIVARDFDDEIYAFENRCAHRGALIALDSGGHARDFTCVYHAWNYDLKGNLKAVAFEDGVAGKGGMAKTFCRSDHGPRKLRIATFCGLVFGSLSDDVPPIEEYLGAEVAAKIQRVLHKPVVVTGRFTQMLPNNWKLYFENVKDTYHASLLHTFFTTFRINRLSQRGGLVISPNGGSHASFSFIDKANKENDYAAMGIRSDKEDFALKDTSLLDNADEFGDGCHMQILSVFPNLVLQQIQNALAVRQVLPKGQTQTALNWTTFGFADDTPEMKTRRLRQNNLAGPAGYVSMEDGAVGGFVQRGVAAAGDERAVVEMGGSDTVGEGTRATEASVRGFWKCYRAHMGLLMASGITLDRILALQAAYIRCIDNNALEDWPEFFLDPCLYVVTSAENHRNGFEGGIIYADTKGMLLDRVAALRHANVYEKQTYRHILGLPNILKNGGDAAESETPFMVARIMHDGASDIFATGIYLDTYRAAGSDLKFAKRLVVCDSSRIDTLMALPL